MNKIRYGSQKPRIDIFNDGDIELAEKTIVLLEHYKMKLLPWQKAELRRWFAVGEDDTWANPDCGLSVPRQNGKTELLIARIIGGMIFLGECLVYTAHQGTTVDEIKRRVLRFFYDADTEIRDLLTSEFDKAPKSFDYVELRNGGRCLFRTRTRSAGLGFTSDTLLIDEAQEENDAQEEALRPTISAGKQHNPQVIMVGTPPTSGSTGTVFMRARRNILAGKAENFCWQEWSVENITATDDVDAWYATNPSLGYFVSEKAIKAESTTMSQDSFNKMRLGWYAGLDAQRIFTDEEWNELAVKEVKLPENPSLVYSVKFAPDRSAVTLAVGVVMGEKIHVEVIERKQMSNGIAWLVRWLLDRWRNCNKIIVDGAAGQGLLIEELVRSEKRITKKILTPNVKEAGSAYASFYQAIQDKTLTHYNQPLLNSAIRTCKRRDIGKDGMFGFAPLNPNIQMDSVDAVAFAYYGANRFNQTRSESKQRMILI